MQLLYQRPFKFRGVPINETVVRDIFRSLISSHIHRSIAWVVLRTLPESSVKLGEEIWLSGFFKEFKASQTCTSDIQALDYSELWGQQVDNIPYFWVEFAGHIASNLARGMEKGYPLFPKVNRIKNVAQGTANQYRIFDPSKSIYDVTTRDLEVLYGLTGVRISGSCEMRAAWKYNDLKPRVYYAQGGQDYFASRYMKLIAVRLMELVESSSAVRRRSPFHYLDVEDADALVYWDYSSFTTSLSELKYFLYYLAEAVKEKERGPIRLFDYNAGLIEINLSELLHSYNETVNIGAPFSIHRMLDRFNLSEALSPDYTQQNNGMLGVAGNIGFSTALHGFASSQVVDRFNSICVGDDAIALVKNGEGVEDLIGHMELLGSIAGDKHSILRPLRGDETQVGKFLKRALIRYSNSTSLDYLFDFAPLPYVDGNPVEGRTVPMPSFHERLYKFSTITGDLLWSIYSHDDNLTSVEMQLLSRFLWCAYKILGLPSRGFLPGHLLQDNVTARYFCPSIRFDCYDPGLLDWLEYLFDEHPTQFYTVPVLAEKHSPVWYETDSCQPQHRFWTAMEDLGYVRLEELEERVESLTEVNKRIFRRQLKRINQGRYTRLQRIVMIKSIPEKFRSFTDPLEEVHVPFEYISL
jgi:hypothetical protein